MSKALLIVADPRFDLSLPDPMHAEVTFKTRLNGEEAEIIPLFVTSEPKDLQRELLDYLEANPEDKKDFPECFSAIEKLAKNFPESENRVKLSDELFSLMSSVIDSLFNQLLRLDRDQMILIVA